jgi:hypothetical protein
MAKDETVRIRPSLLQEDRDAFSALKSLVGYSPSNTAYTINEIQTAQDDLLSKRDAEAQAQAVFDGARDDAVAAEWAFHNKMLGAKDQVIAQFGADSNELQALGLKKKSEYKSPSKPAPATPPTP